MAHKPIYQGNQAKVYTSKAHADFDLPYWQDGHVVKVYAPGAKSLADAEWDRSELFRSSGLPGAITYDSMHGLPGGRIAMIARDGGKSVMDLNILEHHHKLPAAFATLKDQVKAFNQRGIYHNDLNPSNLLWDGHHLNMIDFGWTDEHPQHYTGKDRDLRKLRDTENETLIHRPLAEERYAKRQPFMKELNAIKAREKVLDREQYPEDYEVSPAISFGSKAPSHSFDFPKPGPSSNTASNSSNFIFSQPKMEGSGFNSGRKPRLPAHLRETHKITKSGRLKERTEKELARRAAIRHAMSLIKRDHPDASFMERAKMLKEYM